MQFASAGYFKGIGRIRRFHFQTDIDFQFLFQSFLDVAAGHIFAGPALERRGVDHEVHAQSRLFDLDLRQRFIDAFRTDRITDLDVLDAAQQHDITALGFIDRRSLQSLIVI